jgi:hypothetical protein
LPSRSCTTVEWRRSLAGYRRVLDCRCGAMRRRSEPHRIPLRTRRPRARTRWPGRRSQPAALGRTRFRPRPSRSYPDARQAGSVSRAMSAPGVSPMTQAEARLSGRRSAGRQSRRGSGLRTPSTSRCTRCRRGRRSLRRGSSTPRGRSVRHDGNPPPHHNAHVRAWRAFRRCSETTGRSLTAWDPGVRCLHRDAPGAWSVRSVSW